MVIGALIIAGLVRLILHRLGAIPFNSDEAIVGLMARHIVDGARPVFFYGQAYMGSLDAWVIAGFFQMVGETVAGIRLAQASLYLLFLLTTYWLGRRFYSRQIGAWAVLLGALPPVLVMTYTSATLGGYGEVLVLGNLILLLGHHTLEPEDGEAHPLIYAALGLIGGIGFWTLGIIGVYIAPVVAAHLLRFRQNRIPVYLLAIATFALGCSPWLLANLQLDGEALSALVTGYPLPSTPLQRLMGLAALGLPALLGLRYPWSPTYLPLVWVFIGTLVYAAFIIFLYRKWRTTNRPASLGTWLLLVMVVVFVVAFLATQFGIDSTGRYLLPLYLPLLLGAAHFVQAAWSRRRFAGIAAVVLIIGFNAVGVVSAAANPDGLTTQFDPISKFNNDHDQALIEFLDRQGVQHGYTNYWVSYRLAFLTDERIQLVPALPYKQDLSYTIRDDRIAGYRSAARAADRVVYITTLHPDLNDRLRRAFELAQVEFSETDIGPYHLFYELSRPMPPDEVSTLDLNPIQ